MSNVLAAHKSHFATFAESGDVTMLKGTFDGGYTLRGSQIVRAGGGEIGPVVMKDEKDSDDRPCAKNAPIECLGSLRYAHARAPP